MKKMRGLILFMYSIIGLSIFLATTRNLDCQAVLQAQPAPNVVEKDPLSPEQERMQFTVPKGFKVQLVASEPSIGKPIQMCFDTHGRLWVTTSQEYPFAAKDRPGKDKVYVLEDFAEDGHAKKINCFADDLNIPIGVCPLPSGNELVVYSIPYIYLLRDTNGDNRADEKKILYGPFETRDTHGMVNSFLLGLDGWMYGCHGFSNSSTVQGSDGQKLHMQSGNTYRFRLDGSHIEAWSRGQVNPFGLTFDPWGNLYTADCHSRPITQLIHGAYYSSFGKPHDGLGFGPDMINHDHGSTALCGLSWYRMDHFPKEYQDTMFLGNVVTNRINFDKIEFVGSTPKAIQKPDFLVSKDQWFRPTDIKIGPDGAIYVADFYNRIIGHYEVDLKHPGRDHQRGRIWRIIWAGEDGKNRPQMPKGLMANATDAERLSLVNTPDLTTSYLAALQLIEKPPQNWPEQKTIAQQLVLYWGSARKNQLSATDLIPIINKGNLSEKIQAIEIAGMNSASISNPEIMQLFISFLQPKSDFDKNDLAKIQRAVLLQMALHPLPEFILPLLQFIPTIPGEDTHLLHAARVTLRDQLVASTNSWEQVQKKQLTNDQIRILLSTCLGIANDAAANFIYQHRELLSLSGMAPYVEHVTRYNNSAEKTKQIFNALMNDKKQPILDRLRNCSAGIRGLQKRGSQFPDSIKSEMVDICRTGLESKKVESEQTALELIGTLHLKELYPNVEKFSATPSKAIDRRAQAFEVLAILDGDQAIPFLCQRVVVPNQPAKIRETIVRVLASSNRSEAFSALIQSFQNAPATMATTLALNLANSKEGSERLLQAIAAGKASPRLLQDRGIVDRIRNHHLDQFENRLANLTRGLPSLDQKIYNLLNTRRANFSKSKHNPTNGEQIFTKNCAICHQLSGKGAKIGPQLDGIGVRGLDRLLEDILDPNRNVDEAFRQTRIVRKDGSISEGLTLREEGKLLFLADSQGKEIKINVDDIEERRKLILSPMPANFVDIVTEAEFYDLIAFLLTKRNKD